MARKHEASKQQAGASAHREPELSAGQSYIQNLRRINASERVMKAAQSAVDSEESESGRR